MSNPTETTRTLVIERVFPHPPEKLWRALTDSSLIAQWLMNNDFEPVVGRHFEFRAGSMPNWDGLIGCAVLIVDRPRQLSYTWRALGLDSVVLWTLTPADGGGTHLSMEHSGFRTDQQAAYQGANYGWQSFMDKLARVVGEVD